MCFLFEGVPEGTITTTARLVLNGAAWLFSFLFQLVEGAPVCCECRQPTGNTLLLELTGVFLDRRT